MHLDASVGVRAKWLVTSCSRGVQIAYTAYTTACSGKKVNIFGQLPWKYSSLKFFFNMLGNICFYSPLRKSLRFWLRGGRKARLPLSEGVVRTHDSLFVFFLNLIWEPCLTIRTVHSSRLRRGCFTFEKWTRTLKGVSSLCCSEDLLQTSFDFSANLIAIFRHLISDLKSREHTDQTWLFFSKMPNWKLSRSKTKFGYTPHGSHKRNGTDWEIPTSQEVHLRKFHLSTTYCSFSFLKKNWIHCRLRDLVTPHSVGWGVPVTRPWPVASWARFKCKPPTLESMVEW